MRSKARIDPFWILMMISASMASEHFCPEECACSTQGSGGTVARCHGTLPDLSSFVIDVEHLDVADTTGIPYFQLSPSYFSAITAFKRLFSIRIHNTSLTTVAENAFGGLRNLYDLDLSDNPLLNVFHPDAVSGAAELTILSLSGNAHLYNTIAGPVVRSDSINELDLSRCGIIYLHPDAFALLPGLTYLNLADNKIGSIPPLTFHSLSSLEELDLSGNAISSLPEEMLLNNTELTVLKLRGNPISSLPDTILRDGGDSLAELDLSGTKLTTLAIPPMRSLVHLKLNSSDLSSVDGLAIFPSLQHLNLSDTNISSIKSNSFAGNPLLETILLSSNPKLSLPPRLDSSFSFLYLVDLSKCDLDKLEPDLFIHMKQIATLNLSRNAFSDSEALGKTLSSLSNLRVLDLSYNKLRVIEDDDLSGNLTILLLTGNPLISPPSLKNLPSIHRLDLSKCTLSRVHLPEIFRQAPKLRHISLAGNKLVSVYDQSHLDPDEDDSPWTPPQHLKVLDLSGNPWSCDPPLISLLYEMIRRGVAPSHNPPSRLVQRDSSRNFDEEWRLLEMEVCEDPPYEIEMTLRPLGPPPEIRKTISAKFPIWLILGILLALCLAAAILMYKAFGCSFRKIHTNNVNAAVPSEPGKVNVSLVVPVGGTKRVRGKDYQRLHEDRSPESPKTPRIYKPPPGTKFPYPELEIQVPESSVKNGEGFTDKKNNDP